MKGVNTPFILNSKIFFMAETPFPLLKFAIYEISMQTTSSGPQFNFPVNNYLTGKKVFAIESYNVNDIDRSPVSTGNVTWTAAQMAAASLTLHCYDPLRPGDAGAKGDWIKQMPVNALHRLFSTTAGATGGISVFERMLVGGLVIDWNNSFITFTQNQTFAANTSALFGVYYK